MEDWRMIDGYDGAYWVSDKGRVWSTKRKIFLRPDIGCRGYPDVILCFKGTTKHRKVHRLVMECFSPIEQRLEVNHKNGIKTDNKLENLEWCTCSENNFHRYRVLGYPPSKGGLGRTGSKNSRSKAVYYVDNSGKHVFGSMLEAQRLTKADASRIRSSCNDVLGKKTSGGKVWRYV